ncbi:MAG TPA: ABC transporter ATP-binding protein [Xanthobacteraceae bacterium]|nr:ABC transporter ATP-binding protein [Xanthobacteraceae bacterium]
MLSVRSLFTEYPGERGTVVRAAQDVSFDVPNGKLFTLLGPSGCGKTTTLRSIAGLERPSAGEIEVAGKIMYSSAKQIFVVPNKRNFGMVFQSYAIWPHMNVFQNAAFPLQVRKLPKKDIKARVMRVLEAVQLDQLVDREATKLSGGQQQRLALARALVMEPQLLLLDEPLSNLDAKLRDRMRSELKRLQRELGLTTVYVTHDQSEALALSHEIAVMNDGRVVQIGTPRQIYEQPANQFVADFVGTTNFIGATVSSVDEGSGRCLVGCGMGPLRVQASQGVAKGDAVTVSVRPEDVELSEAPLQAASGDNLCKAVVVAKDFLGEHLDFQVKVGDVVLLARAHPSLRTPVGDSIYLRLKTEKCVAIPAATGAISVKAAPASTTSSPPEISKSEETVPRAATKAALPQPPAGAPVLGTQADTASAGAATAGTASAGTTNPEPPRRH